MDKKNPTLTNMVLVLLCISLVCSAGVAYIYNVTKPTIESSRLAKKQVALSKVLPQFDNSPIDEKFNIVSANNDTLACYPAKLNNEFVGYAVESFSNKGFGGKIEVLVGFLPDGSIFNTEVVTLNETPGLGDKSDKKKSDWSEQFNGKNPQSYKLKVKKDGGDVDAITAATITSRAYTEAVDLAYKSFMGYSNHEKPEAVSGATSHHEHHKDADTLQNNDIDTTLNK
ncbi:MAG: RnfABCDGE type electron transport complex subunit G [Bacteroidales bacterium]|nr:RnfABCDGE type electron transport complex subunit G [Bacteroidales bacterium]